jgi:hypothetical protein
MTNTAATTWWTRQEFEAMRQELVRPTFRRSALMQAQWRYRRLARRAVKRGVPLMPFHEWVPQGVRRSDCRLTQEIVRELFDYNPETGVLTHRWRDRRWFESDRIWKTWNIIFAGTTAGSPTDKEYLNVGIFGRLYSVHRVIFLWMTGRLPDPEVDHENHGRADNRWANLFEATKQKNMRNQTLRKDNISGRVGVSWCADRDKFYAYIDVKGRRLHLGYHDTFEAACAAREAAEVQYGFHPNHGASKVR